ncbi:hypothetical protein JYK02_34910 [Corallococcus macrosporus]|uniref:CHAT domain-containing protein n=1 Tax=Corallococcus macrosporus TaxID=35 RepID=A0ABS3DN26_9BACT|nr:hypothetical protein [Corallococcus macrosporus]MBN8232722.1 hypothetical protein [Corallococcus macrosporus]
MNANLLGRVTRSAVTLLLAVFPLVAAPAPRSLGISKLEFSWGSKLLLGESLRFSWEPLLGHELTPGSFRGILADERVWRPPRLNGAMTEAPLHLQVEREVEFLLGTLSLPTKTPAFESLEFRATAESAQTVASKAQQHQWERWLHISSSHDRLVLRWDSMEKRGRYGMPEVVFFRKEALVQGETVAQAGERGVNSILSRHLLMENSFGFERSRALVLEPRRPVDVDLGRHHIILDVSVAADTRGLDLPASESVYVHTRDGQLMPAHPWQDAQGKTHFDVVVAPNLTLRPNGRPELLEDFEGLGRMRFREDDVRIASLVDDFQTNRVIAENFSGKLLPIQEPSLNGLRQTFSESQGRMLVLVAHREGAHLVWRNLRGGGEKRIDIGKVLHLARTTNTRLLLATCEAAVVVGEGPTTVINSLAWLRRLSHAVKAPTYRGVFERLATEEAPFLVGESTIKGAQDVFEASVVRSRTRRAVQGALITVYLLWEVDEEPALQPHR